LYLSTDLTNYAAVNVNISNGMSVVGVPLPKDFGFWLEGVSVILTSSIAELVFDAYQTSYDDPKATKAAKKSGVCMPCHACSCASGAIPCRMWTRALG
jgi:hypothetical protein